MKIFNSTNSLLLAEKYQIETIAFPNISTGIYRFPKINAANIAIETAGRFLNQTQQIKEVVFVCFDEENHSIYKELLSSSDQKGK